MTTSKRSSWSATEFKAHCLELMDDVRATGRRITITKRGKPIAQLVPIPQSGASVYGALPVTIVGDLTAPLDEAWDADA